ncbi:helix-turn-helix domain-containing protein [Dysgonomonas sp. 511]|uniref:helix-turn-helix domain-containing protein n=1 Tax=Dysgonomonas sp. 511 TaxID=2302930 RepID=UPI0013D0AFF6|nr:helix-turn-helix domain-containing protein [Dysgonomonas sp. 511]NDV79739.1 AraC family transcriptional regulator [Dysgonomonas sp. 511]
MKKDSVHIKYLITNERDIQWGLTVNSVGFQHIKPGEPYPPQNHPTRYLFSTEKGRVLEEYQLIYITEGRGKFISGNCKAIDVSEGKMFLLFPGEWHSYQPDKAVGWDEYWIGFKGVNIDNRIDKGFFSDQKPIFNVGIQQDIVQLYKLAIDAAKEQKFGFQQMLAGVVNLLLGYAYSYDKQSSFEEMKATKQINKAKVIILDNLYTQITPEEIASKLNMSYSWFRRIFKQYTGFSPSQYIIELRIQKGKELLTNTDMPSQEVAYEIGFENPDYFCTLFKKKTGMTPFKYREFTQGQNLPMQTEKE